MNIFFEENSKSRVNNGQKLEKEEACGVTENTGVSNENFSLSGTLRIVPLHANEIDSSRDASTCHMSHEGVISEIFTVARDPHISRHFRTTL